MFMGRNDEKKNIDKEKSFSRKKKKLIIKQKKHTKVHDTFIEKSNKFNIIEVIIIIIISVIFGLVVGWVLSSSKSFGTEVSLEVSEIVSTYESILDNYYYEIDKGELADAAIKGMIGVLDDPYSLYMDSDDTNLFLENVNGSFVGIGISVEWSNNQFKIVDVIKDSPADESKIEINDYIIKVNENDVSGLSLEELSNLIKGKVGTKVSLTLLRGEDVVNVIVTRDNVAVPSVNSYVLVNNIGYIFIESFTENSGIQFKEALKSLEKQSINSLIIDVRDNPGGKLGQVNKILDVFLDKKHVLYQIVNKDDNTKIYADSSDKKDIPIVVLVNHNSASASEILASSFQDNYDNATIVGSVTYGKGTIQKAVELSSGSSIKYTTQKWLTPKGKWINEIGIIPDEVITQSDLYSSDKSYDNDLQLQKAVEILKNK